MSFLKPRNVLVASIVALALGGLGESLQPSRLILLFGLPLASSALVHFELWQRVELLTLQTYALLVGLGVLSLAWSPARVEGLGLLLVVLIGMSSLLYVRLTPKTVGAARQVRDAWSFALALTLPVAVYELATGDHFAYAFEQRNLGGDIGAAPFASVFFGNFNNYCTFIALSLPMLFGTIESATRRLARWVWVTCALLAAVVVVVNTNRISMIFLSWLTLYFALTRKAWRRAILVLALIAAALVATGALDDVIDSIMLVIDLRFEGLGTDESADQRGGLILAGLHSLASTYGMGVGVGAFEDYLVFNFPDLIPNPHNLFLELAVNFGVLGAFAFGACLVYLFVSLIRSPLPRDLRDPMLATLPFVPAIGAINSHAVGYTYWWLWLGTGVLLTATGQSLRLRRASPAATAALHRQVVEVS